MNKRPSSSPLVHTAPVLQTLYRFGSVLLIGAVIGVPCGALGALFHHAVDLAGRLRGELPFLLYLLPAAGLLIVALYRGSKTTVGVNDVLSAVCEEKTLPLRTVPVIFLSTFLTQLCGGSAGKEGAALQMGGTIGFHAARLFRLDEKDSRMAVMCGLAAFFAAVFGTPVTAALFALEVVCVGKMYFGALVPCLCSSLTAFGISRLMGTEPLFYTVAFPEAGAGTLLAALLLGAVCAVAAILFCAALEYAEKGAAAILKNPYLRIVAGGMLILCLTLLLGTKDYNGAGLNLIEKSLAGEAVPLTFLIKILFTAVTVGCGFKGGEIVPTMAVGAALGCAVASLLGFDCAFFAAVSLVAMFSGMVNCPVTSILLGVELFGAEGLLFFAVASAVSYALSGRFKLYSAQKLLSSKLHHEFTEEFADP